MDNAGEMEALRGCKTCICLESWDSETGKDGKLLDRDIPCAL